MREPCELSPCSGFSFLPSSIMAGQNESFSITILWKAFKYQYLDSSIHLRLTLREDSNNWFFLPWNFYFQAQVNWCSSSTLHIVSQATPMLYALQDTQLHGEGDETKWLKCNVKTKTKITAAPLTAFPSIRLDFIFQSVLLGFIAPSVSPRCYCSDIPELNFNQ